MTAPSPTRSRPALSRALLWTLFARMLMLSVFLLSVGLVGWSLHQLYRDLPVLGRQIRDKDSTRAALAGEVQQLEMTWDAAAMEKLEAQCRDARELLFADAQEQEKWSNELKQRARALAFEMEFRRDPAQPHPATNQAIALVPATLQVKPLQRGGGLTNSPYERLLDLAASFENSRRRIDVTELSVTSDSNSVYQTRATLRLWAQEKRTP
jgi:hypothetical protein